MKTLCPKKKNKLWEITTLILEISCVVDYHDLPYTVIVATNQAHLQKKKKELSFKILDSFLNF